MGISEFWARAGFNVSAVPQPLCLAGAASQDLDKLLDAIHREVSQSPPTDRRSMAALVSQLRNEHTLLPMQENSQHSLNNASPPSPKSHSMLDDDIVPLIMLAESLGREQAHAALCGALAEALDQKPAGQVQQLQLDALSPAAVLRVLANVKDLGKAITAFPFVQKLLRQPEAEAVYAPRIAAAAPLYRSLLATHRGDGLTWQDAWTSYCAVCDGSAPIEQLVQLLGMCLESLTLGTPKNLGELTFFVTLLAAIAQRRSPVEAAQALFEAVSTIRAALQRRLSAVLQTPPGLGATEYFTLLAQTKELLSRSKELVATLVHADVRRQFLNSLSRLQDSVTLNFGVSDKVAALQRALLPASVAASPLLTHFLSGPYAAMLPPAQRERLALPPLPVTHAGALAPKRPLSVRCCGGCVVDVPVTLLRPLARLDALVGIFSSWQAQAGAPRAHDSGAPDGARPDVHAVSPPDTHVAVPLPVLPHVLRATLDCAFGVTMEPVLGGDAAKVTYLRSWAAEVRATPTLLAGVREFAELAGFSDCVQLLDCTADMPCGGMAW